MKIHKYIFSTTFLMMLNLIVHAQSYIQTTDSIPMRDGKKLAADIYLPSSTGQFPVILVQTPYNRLFYRINQPLGLGSLPGLPYALVVVDWRGYYGSANAMVANPDRGKDGYDIVEWISSQPWSNSKIGTWGPSALGKIQYQTAKENPPHLTCAAPLVAGPQFNYSEYFPGGVFRKEYVDQLDNLGFGLSTFLLANPYYSNLWQYVENQNYYPQSIQIPMFMIGGWYDHNVEVMMQMFEGLKTSSPVGVRAKHKLMMGPWAHGGFGTAQVGTCNQGELVYNEACKWSDSLSLRFFDYYLRNIDNNWEQEPIVRYFQMGENTWQQTPSWPPTGTSQIKLYLNNEGVLSSSPPTSMKDSSIILYDPRNPSPTVGGATLRSDLQQGPYNQAPSVENRNDILTFTTPLLSQNVVLKGNGRVHLFVSSDRTDTDFATRLTDVYPDGRSMLLTDNIQRMRFRNGYSTNDTVSMLQNHTYEVDIQIPDLAITFLAGHKIRIDITSSNYPRFDNNLNNGSTMYVAGDTMIATNVVHFSSTKASFIELPLESYPLSIYEANNIENEHMIFPNPIESIFSINDLDYTTINIYNIDGKKQFSQSKSPNYDISSLNSGIYFLEINSIHGRVMKKIIKL